MSHHNTPRCLLPDIDTRSVRLGCEGLCWHWKKLKGLEAYSLVEEADDEIHPVPLFVSEQYGGI